MLDIFRFWFLHRIAYAANRLHLSLAMSLLCPHGSKSNNANKKHPRQFTAAVLLCTMLFHAVVRQQATASSSNRVEQPRIEMSSRRQISLQNVQVQVALLLISSVTWSARAFYVHNDQREVTDDPTIVCPSIPSRNISFTHVSQNYPSRYLDTSSFISLSSGMSQYKSHLLTHAT